MAANTAGWAKRNIYAPAPATTRGKPVRINASPDGTKMIYANGSSIVLRDIENPLDVDMYSEHSYNTTLGAYAPSGFYVCSGDAMGNIRIWDTINAEHILKDEFQILAGPIHDIAWSPDSQRLIIVGEGRERYGAAILADGGSSVGSISGHSKPITTCDFKPSRPFRVATGGEDNQSNFYAGPPFKFVKSNKEHARFVNCVRYSPDGARYVTVSADKTIQVYDGKEGELLGEMTGHGGGIYGCAWSPDGNELLTVSADKTAKIWAMDAMEEIQTFTFSANPTKDHQQLGCAWVGENLITVALNGDITYLDRANPDTPLRVLKGHQNFITALAYDAETNRLISGSYDGVMIAWDVDSNDMTPFGGNGHTNQINCIAISGDNVVTCSMDDTVRTTSLDAMNWGASIPTDSPATGVAVSQEDPDLIVCACINAVYVMRGGAVVSKTDLDKSCAGISLSPDDAEVAVATDSGIYIFALNGNDLEQTNVIDKPRGAVTCVEYSHDGASLASADAARDVFIFDRNNGYECTQTGWVHHAAKVTCLSWRADDQFIVTGALDTNLICWNVATGKKHSTFPLAHPGGVSKVCWIGETVVASAGQDSAIRTWDLVL